MYSNIRQDFDEPMYARRDARARHVNQRVSVLHH
jgi:hypothetical protein